MFADLRLWVDVTLARISGKSDLAGAIRYTTSRWNALTLVLRAGRACIDNNAAERSMRPVCLDEKAGCLLDRTPVATGQPRSAR